jgi:hypothetical protein
MSANKKIQPGALSRMPEPSVSYETKMIMLSNIIAGMLAANKYSDASIGTCEAIVDKIIARGKNEKQNS